MTFLFVLGNIKHTTFTQILVDHRICLEYVCDEIDIQFVFPEDKNKWARYKLHDKIKATKAFMDSAIVEKLLLAKVIGNKGAHKGEEGEFTAYDIDNALDAISTFKNYGRANGLGVCEEREYGVFCGQSGDVLRPKHCM